MNVARSGAGGGPLVAVARPVFGGHGVARLGAAARLEQMTVRPIGPDFVVEGRLRFPSRRSDGA